MKRLATVNLKKTTPLGLPWLRAMGVAAVVALALPLGPILGWIVAKGPAVLHEALAAFLLMTSLIFLWHAAMLTVMIIGYVWVTESGRRHQSGLATLIGGMSVAGFIALVAVRSSGHKGVPDAVLSPAYGLQLTLTFATFFAIAYDYMQRTRRTADATHAAELRRVELEGELAAARLLLLQAQVEPHFLFNTLANLRRLVRTDRAAARAMLADLRRYLEVALPSLRDERSTLARELSLLQAYLAIHQVRMGTRLRTEFDVPAELGARDLPPMLLLTLVENAIKHGVQPLVEGAVVRVEARADDGWLTLRVSDTGRGMASGSGGGSGLANVRARLRAIYGTTASLRLSVNEPRGVVATIVLPESTP
jgi:sensor histidine kinase YesM